MSLPPARTVRDQPASPPDRQSDIRLSMPARAENVAIVRQVIASLAEALGMSERAIDDVRLAVTEACTNVVRHAYRDIDGPLEVTIRHADEMLTISVFDHGDGIRPSPHSDGPGLGLPLIAALSDSLVIERSRQGSSVAMGFFAHGRALETA